MQTIFPVASRSGKIVYIILKAEIKRVYDENHSVYGVRKVWRQLLREHISLARCTVARLMKAMGLAGVRWGKKVRTTVSRKDAAAGDRVNRQFVAERPDQLWVADFTYVSTWQGFAYVAFMVRNLEKRFKNSLTMNRSFAGRGMYMKGSVKYGDEGGKNFGCAAGMLPAGVCI